MSLDVRFGNPFPLCAAPLPGWDAQLERVVTEAASGAVRARSDSGAFPRGPSGLLICHEVKRDDWATGIRTDAIERVRGPRSAHTGD